MYTYKLLCCSFYAVCSAGRRMKTPSYRLTVFPSYPKPEVNPWWSACAHGTAYGGDSWQLGRCELPIYIIPAGTVLYRGDDGTRDAKQCLDAPCLWLGDLTTSYGYCAAKFNGTWRPRPGFQGSTNSLPKLFRFKTTTDIRILALDRCEGVEWLARRMPTPLLASQYIRAAFDCSEGGIEPLRTSTLEWDTHIVNALCRLFHMMSTQYGLTPGYATKKLRRVRGGGYLHPEVFLCKPGGVMTFDGEVTCGITDPQQHRNLPLLKRPRDTGGAESPQDGFVRRFPKLRRAISRPV